MPEIEGDLIEITDFEPAPMICDNNLLAASKKHIRKVVDKLKQYKYVDFNQGLQASRFTPQIADWLGELRCKVRFAFDSLGQEKFVKDAIDICRERTTKDIGVYVLIGYDDSPEEARYKLDTVRSWGVLPNPMRYQPKDAKVKDDYIHPRWTDNELKKMMHYYSRLIWLSPIPYEEYHYSNKDDQMIMELI